MGCTIRHNLVLKALGYIFGSLGLLYHEEPSWYGNPKRPDMWVAFPDDNILIDVAIVCPLAPSHASSTLINPLTSLKSKETAKCTKYRSQAREWGCKFRPFVMDSFGRLGPKTRELLTDIISLGSSMPRDSTFCVPSDFRNIIHNALQRGNAQLQLDASAKHRRWMRRSLVDPY